jgi:hypothetical protein
MKFSQGPGISFLPLNLNRIWSFPIFWTMAIYSKTKKKCDIL